MKALVVIVNYRTPGLTVDCLQSLAPEIARTPGVQVVVTDNKSPDDSVEVIGKAIQDLGYSSWCRFMPLEKNGGFAYGNNEAIRAYLSLSPSLAPGERRDEPDLIWLLNPDTIVLEGALTELIAFMEAHPHVGIAGGRAVNRDGSARRTSFRFISPLSELEGAMQFGPASKVLKNHVVAPGIPDVPTRTGWVSGASMMVRRDVFEKVGLLDDAFFMYYEETDFCLRAARAGFECWYVPQSRIIHLVGQASGVTGAQRALKRRPKYWFESRARYFRKNFGVLAMHTANLFWLTGYPFGRAWQAMRGKHPEDPPKLWWDFLRYNYLPCHR